MSTLEIPVTSAGPRPPVLARRAWVEHVMGTAVSVHVRALDPGRADVEAAVDRAVAHLRRVETVLSTWRADSDLLRLQHGETDTAHAWVADVAELALEAEERTDGLFRAWRSRTGGRTVFDPTGLVKGWAVAGAAAHLDVVPEISYSIGAGGDVVVGAGPGPSADGPPWRVGVQDPYRSGRVAEVLTLRRGGVATSGASARGGHVLDPRSGRPVRRAGSCTVVGPDLTWADVWATAAWVDPGRAARLLAERDPGYRLVVL
ncbi:FAD:protein FMN transferase [Phycicoccus endophyticus]|uniref:FAD:protein FMN transferase n=1 Tax=Phycicoccus endophyticus TaxID=1690220 RepID=A0A7G9QY45_9MICO|nr:FAD:protein FMN transferase [Phycicoccus endophyticus]NHI19153.1 FAD:protein FMN transferase [Phycicoccus endophyticus]QNN48270.1 FAD:protein FMN transferase [Phycicoccus endophyticus]GGL40573.1 FAD:protein FMN transferase [Phycicoccus endophyticus]